MTASAEQLRSQIHTEANDLWPQMVKWRRMIHQNPELAWEETETAKLVDEVLTNWDIQTETGVAKTGVVGTLDTGLAGPTVVLRADMDALPVHETTQLPFASKHPGRMHACGHDMHTASLLGTAAILRRLQDHLRGSVRFVFQPAEERLPGGAKDMIQEGCLESASVAFAQHVFPGQPTGTIGVRPGAFMASADEIYLSVRGEGGHAAAPHRLQADAVLAASHIIVALQSIISRNCPPDIPSVLSFGKMVANGATNVMADVVQIEGTFRSMDEAWRTKAHDLIHRVVTQTAETYGATANVDIKTGYPMLHNDPDLALSLQQTAWEYVGESNTVDLDLWFASEDFAYILEQTPGVFYTLGVGQTSALHTSEFSPDESALRTGSGFMAYLAWKQLWA